MSKKNRQNRSQPGAPMTGAATLPGRAGWRREVWLGLGLGLLILIFYANSFNAGLTFDSRVLIGQDSRLRAWDSHNLSLIFTKGYWWPLESDLYRPLTTLSYLFNYAVLGSGEQVASYHVINLLLHWANAWLVLVIVRRLTGRRDVAALAAALFAVHPVNVEAVTNIVGRADLLATLSILFGGWCYLRAAASRGPRKFGWLLGLAVSACLGVLAKESAVMIVAFVVLYDGLWRWPKIAGRSWDVRLRAAAKEFFLQGYIALAPALLLFGLVRHWLANNSPVLSQSFVDNPLVAATPFAGFMTAIGVVGRELGLLVFPGKLSVDYSYHQIPLYGEPGNFWDGLLAWASLAMVVALLLAAWRFRRGNPLLAWGVVFFLAMLLPTSNLLVLIGSIMAERFLYLPSIGFCVVAALALQWASAAAVARVTAGKVAAPAFIVWALPVFVLCALGLRTFARNADWHDDLSLWKSAVAASPSSLKPYKGYASALWNDGPRNESAVDAAITQVEISLSILDQVKLPIEHQDEALFLNLGEYYCIKGKFLEDRGQGDPTRLFYQKAVDILTRAREVDRHGNQAWHDASLRRGRPPEEIVDVGDFRIYCQLGLAQERLGHWAEAEEAGRWIEHLVPDELSGYVLVGDALAHAGRWSDAAVSYLEVVLLTQKNDEAWTGLLLCYDKLGIQPPPVVAKGNDYALYDDNPSVRLQMNQAAVEVVKLFEAVRRFDEARGLRATFIKNFAVPPDVFSAK